MIFNIDTILKALPCRLVPCCGRSDSRHRHLANDCSTSRGTSRYYLSPKTTSICCDDRSDAPARVELKVVASSAGRCQSIVDSGANGTPVMC